MFGPSRTRHARIGGVRKVGSEPDRLRNLWRAYWAECSRIYAENAARHDRFLAAHAAGRYQQEEPDLSTPPFPDELRGLACGARTRKAQPCKRTDLHPNGRCKHHGGLSTGPKSEEGKSRARSNLLLRHAGPSEPHERTTNDVIPVAIATEHTSATRDVSPDRGTPIVKAARAPEPQGGMTKQDILAAIAAVATKRRAREKPMKSRP